MTVFKAINFVKGGKVKKKHSSIPKKYIKVSKNDTVLARLMPNELVIPIKFVHKVEQFLKKENIILPGMNRSKLK
jgi:hypothetical protein